MVQRVCDNRSESSDSIQPLVSSFSLPLYCNSTTSNLYITAVTCPKLIRRQTTPLKFVTVAINSFIDVALPPTMQPASRKQTSEERMQYLMLKSEISLHKSDLEKVNLLLDIVIMFQLIILTLFDQETPPKPRMAKPWEDPGLRGKKKMLRSSSRGAPFLIY
jgi:hypothetical protein